MKRIFFVVIGCFVALQLSACGLAVGAGAVVVADEIIENEKGGDGLF